MGQKTHPVGFRLGVIKTWNSRWFARRDFGTLVVEDRKIRDYIKKRLFRPESPGLISNGPPIRLKSVFIRPAPASSSARRALKSKFCAQNSKNW